MNHFFFQKLKSKVAGIFKAGGNRAKKLEIKRNSEATEDVNINLDSALTENEKQYEEILSSRVKIEDKKKPKYIFAALEKADERKAFADEMKNLSLEREIKKLEEENGPYIRFYTNRDEEPVEVPDEEILFNEKLETGEIEIIQPKQIDFEGMKQRYMKRLEENDILKLKANAKKIKLILNYGQIAFSKDEQSDLLTEDKKKKERNTKIYPIKGSVAPKIFI